MSTANRSHVPPALAAAAGLSSSSSPPGSPSSLAPSGPVDFRVFSGGMATYGFIDGKGVVTKAEDGQYPYLNDLLKLVGKDELMGELAQLPRPVVQMTGSSTEQDLDGDIMYASAVADMTQVDDRLSICLNHSYNLPEDLYGSLVEQPWTRSQGGITDLYLRSDVAVLNPRAVTTYLYTAQGRRIGVSGGFCVLEAEWIDRKTGKPLKDQDVDFFDVMEGVVSLGIKHVKAVEWSTVTIPSNQRSWVEGAIKGYFARTFDPKIAPIVRASLTQADYNKIIVQAADPALRKQLEDVMPRKVASASPRRIYWNPMDGVFTLGTGQTLERKDVQSILKHAGAVELHHVPQFLPDPEGDPMPDLSETWSGEDENDDLTTKAASDEDKAAQEARSKKYGIGIKEGGNVTKPSKWKDVPDEAWGDPVNYKLPMPDKEHADNAASRFAQEATRSQYTPKEQDIISQRIEARQRSFGEEPEGKSATVPSVERTEDTRPTSKAGQNEMQKKARGVTIAADGSHESMTGTHTHAHKAFGAQGDDDMHEHEHTHKGDSDHHHTHDDGQKAGEPDKSTEAPTDKTAAGGQSGESAGTPQNPNVPVADDGTHAPMTGKHSHKHAAYGMADSDDGGNHAHEHEHNSDGDHGHDHMSTTATAGKAPKALDLSDPELQAAINTYNWIGAKHGLPTITAEGTVDLSKCALVDNDEDAQRVISLVSEADLYADALDGTIDRLMRTLGVRDVDKDGDGNIYGDGDAGDGSINGDSEIPAGDELLPNPSYPMYRQQSLDATARMLVKLLGISQIAKAGARNSKADRDSIQMIHDAAAKLTDGEVCKTYAMQSETQEQGDNTPAEGGSGTSEQDARDEESGKKPSMGANTHTRGFDPEMLKAIPDLVTSSQSILDMLGKLDLKGYEDAVQDARLKLASVNKAVSGYEARQKELEAHAQAIGEQYTVLTNLPLPRPTHLNRSLNMEDPLTREATATYSDMQKVNGANAANKAAVQQGAVPGDGGPLTLKQALALTEVVEVDGIPYRHWPEGVTPLGGRPALTNEQKQFTRTAVEWAYTNDEEAYIPLRGESIPAGE